MKPARIIIFAKAPQPGLAKTRLIPALGAEGAAELAQLMLLHTVNEALAANIAIVELCVTPSSMTRLGTKFNCRPVLRFPIKVKATWAHVWLALRPER